MCRKCVPTTALSDWFPPRPLSILTPPAAPSPATPRPPGPPMPATAPTPPLPDHSILPGPPVLRPQSRRYYPMQTVRTAASTPSSPGCATARTPLSPSSAASVSRCTGPPASPAIAQSPPSPSDTSTKTSPAPPRRSPPLPRHSTLDTRPFHDSGLRTPDSGLDKRTPSPVCTPHSISPAAHSFPPEMCPSHQSTTSAALPRSAGRMLVDGCSPPPLADSPACSARPTASSSRNVSPAIQSRGKC